MQSNDDEDRTSQRFYKNEDRGFRLIKARERFDSNSSTRRAFANVAQYNNYTSIDSLNGTVKQVQKRESSLRENGLPPSSSTTSTTVLLKNKHVKSKSAHHQYHSENGNTPKYTSFEAGTIHIDNRNKRNVRQSTRENYNRSLEAFDSNFFHNAQYVQEDFEELERGNTMNKTAETNHLLQEIEDPYGLDQDVYRYDDFEADTKDQNSEINLFSQLALGLDPSTVSDVEKYRLANNESFFSNKKSPSFWEYFHSLYDATLTKWFYDEKNPEFTSLQQINWAIIIGVLMGIFTAVWALVVDIYVDIVWKVVPEKLYEWGVFTDLYGPRPLPHYIWVCTGFFGGVLSLITVILPTPIPGQNEWIKSLHRKGVIEYNTIIPIFLIAISGMASGLSLGPELPLVLTSGMAGSYFAKRTHQSVLSSRVLNLTAASAAIGGFFGFPMAGALFVLELPHRMGLQYFEALHPAIVASIAAVLTNRMVVQNDVKGYFNYPFLTTTLPSHIFYVAVLYGLVGGLVGMFYTNGCIFLKMNVHDLFHFHDHDESKEERKPHGNNMTSRAPKKKNLDVPPRFVFHNLLSCHIKNEPLRATIVGVIAGVTVGVIGMFLPAVLFWGEEQLQSIIDNGATPLPVFGTGDEMTADLTAYGYCMPKEQHGLKYSMHCSAILAISKVVTYGFSLGTGIVGGQFWGPLFVGATAANLFTSLMEKCYNNYGFGLVLTKYPCLALICMMGASHVVTFRATMAIMLILTLTISSFDTETGTGDTGGDYSAIFPLLVISCYISLMMTRDTVFYKKQSCRGDLIVTQQSLCEPGKEGSPITHLGDELSGSSIGSVSSFLSERGDESDDRSLDDSEYASLTKRTVTTDLTEAQIERNFAMQNQGINETSNVYEEHDPSYGSLIGKVDNQNGANKERSAMSDISSVDYSINSIDTNTGASLIPRKPMHRRIRSEDVKSNMRFKEISSSNNEKLRIRSNSLTRKMRSDGSTSDRSSRNSSRRSGSRRRVDSFGEIGDDDMQPNLLDQARMRAASTNDDLDMKNPLPKAPKSHRKKSSFSGSSNLSNQITSESAGGMPQGDIERAFNSICNQEYIG